MLRLQRSRTDSPVPSGGSVIASGLSALASPRRRSFSSAPPAPPAPARPASLAQEGDGLVPIGGTIFGEDGRSYELGSLLGKGSGGTVFRAVETTRNVRRPVAVKLYATVSSDEAEQVYTTIAEAAQRTAWVRHPNVVDVYDCGLVRGQPFLVSELVDGVSLHAFAIGDVARRSEGLRRKRLPLDLVLHIACEVADALAAARTTRDPDGFSLDLVHLGLSCREVLLSWRGEVKVEGFELASVRWASSSVRSMNAVVSRAAALAPEVAAGDEGDARSDIFSLGLLLRELLVGPRFPAGLRNADAIRLAREGYVEPATFGPQLPDALVGIIECALALEPTERYATATAMAYELRRLALSMGVSDGRYFLRTALAREHAANEDITAEHSQP